MGVRSLRQLGGGAVTRYMEPAVLLFVGLLFIALGSGDGAGRGFAWWVGVVTSGLAVAAGLWVFASEPDDDDGWGSL